MIPKLTVDSEKDVVFVEMRGMHLETQKDIRAFFDAIVAFWRARCGGEKVYFIVCYDGFSVNLRENEYYARQMKQCSDECAKTVVRYGGDDLQRSAARLRGMKIHSPSNLYATREEAIEVVRAIRTGAVSIATRART